MYKIRRLHHSQNFLRDPELVKKLLRKSSIGKKDTVFEIGPGKGIITRELIRVAGYVISLELDDKLYGYLKKDLQDTYNSELIHGNILNYKLPNYPYKVFANIPFSITADIIRKLTSDRNFHEGYLIVQKEFAQKVIGIPYDTKNQMMSVLLKPWFDVSVFYEFTRNDFYPRPNIDTTMIRINRVRYPMVSGQNKRLYENFVLYTFNKSKVSHLSNPNFLKLYEKYLRRNNPNETRLVDSEAERIRNFQNKLEKIHRTRNDRNWRRFKK